MQEIERFASKDVNKLLVGNKCDLEEKREVAYEEGLELAKQYDVPFLEVSAKNATNVEETFTKMASDIHERFLQTKKRTRDPLEWNPAGGSVSLTKPSSEGTVSMSEEKKKNSNCCA